MRQDFSNFEVGIVFGAGVNPDRTPSTVLTNRLNAALGLYEQGHIEKILVSGDNREVRYDEPASMRDFLVKNGVPIQDIILDFGGRSTADTCYRAKNYFGVDRAILITQLFHLPRANFFCTTFGMQTSVYRAVNARGTLRSYLREIPASWAIFTITLNPYFQPEVGSDGSEQKII